MYYVETKVIFINSCLFYSFVRYHFGSYNKFAKYLGCSCSFVSAFVSGKRAVPEYVISKVLNDYGFDILSGHYVGVEENEKK